MYDYSYNYNVYDYGSSVGSAGGILAGLGVFFLFVSATLIFSIVCMWKLFKKAGKPGWASVIPIYNVIVLLEIAELPMWYIVLFMVPFANIYAIFKIYIEIAHKFNKSTGFGVAMVFFSIICMPILAFGKAKYKNTVVNVNNVDTSVNTQNNVLNNMNVNLQGNTTNSVQNNFVSSGMPNVIDFNNNGNASNNLNNGTISNSQFSNSAFQPVGNVTNNIQNDNYFGNVVQDNSSNLNMMQDNLSLNNNMNSVSSNIDINNNMNSVSSNIDINNNMNSVSSNINNYLNNNLDVNYNMGQVNNIGINDNNQNMNTYNNQNMQSNLNQNINVTSSNCPNCGSQIVNGTSICSNCGYNIK